MLNVLQVLEGEEEPCRVRDMGKAGGVLLRCQPMDKEEWEFGTNKGFVGLERGDKCSV